MLGHRDAQPGRNIQSEISGEVGCAGWRGTEGWGRTREGFASFLPRFDTWGREGGRGWQSPFNINGTKV